MRGPGASGIALGQPADSKTELLDAATRKPREDGRDDLLGKKAQLLTPRTRPGRDHEGSREHLGRMGVARYLVTDDLRPSGAEEHHGVGRVALVSLARLESAESTTQRL